MGMRICSLLPGATETLFRLGLGDQIVGVTHECDYPPEAKLKPVVVRSAIDSKRLTSSEIDRAVEAVLQGGNALYTLDQQALRDAAPDLILTQGLCDVCALDHHQVVEAARALPRQPDILALNPRTLSDLLSDILRVGAATKSLAAAEALTLSLSTRIDCAGGWQPVRRPRVVCLEWFEPLYVAGHWVPEVVERAGGNDVLGRDGQASAKIAWQQIIEAQPDVLLLMPCGFDVRRTVREATPLRRLGGWNDLPAVKTGNVFALNGSAYFSRPGPRLVDGLEILGRILHPGHFSSPPAPTDAERVIH
jgi:iron complex transport system substrate-binding protein